MKWIEKIIEVENYRVVTKWNDSKIRVIDFEDFLIEKSKNPNSTFAQLFNIKTFKNVKCDGTTLFWENMIDYVDLDGSIKKGNLDISPEFLLELSNVMQTTP